MFLVGDCRFILRPRGDHSILVGEAYFQHENILKGIEEMDVRSTWGRSRIEAGQGLRRWESSVTILSRLRRNRVVFWVGSGPCGPGGGPPGKES
jgi:hypothetical protein